MVAQPITHSLPKSTCKSHNHIQQQQQGSVINQMTQMQVDETHEAEHFVTKVTLQSVASMTICGGLQGGQIFYTHFAIKYPFPCFFIFLLTFLETFAPPRLGAKLPLGRLQQGFIIETGLPVSYCYNLGILLLRMN